MIEELVEIKLTNDENFLKVKETLTRIGIASRKEKKLYQSCHILHKQGRYFIVHFKEMFKLDGKTYDTTDEDIERRNTIIALLAEWGLIKVVDPTKIQNQAPLSQVKVISFKEKNDWTLTAKYTIGRKK